MPVTNPPDPSPFAKKVAATAQNQFDTYEGYDESDTPLKNQIKKYWQAIGQAFPGVGTAWSAVFVSYCVKKGGAASNEFKFAAAHALFVHDAINNPDAYEGVKIDQEAVNVGDIIQNNRENNSYDFQYAKNNFQYYSHSAIVVDRGIDSVGKYAVTVGGNEGDSVRSRKVRLNSNGTIKQKAANDNPYICLLKCRK